MPLGPSLSRYPRALVVQMSTLRACWEKPERRKLNVAKPKGVGTPSASLFFLNRHAEVWCHKPSQVKSKVTPRRNTKAARSVNHSGLPGGLFLDIRVEILGGAHHPRSPTPPHTSGHIRATHARQLHFATLCFCAIWVLFLLLYFDLEACELL